MSIYFCNNNNNSSVETSNNNYNKYEYSKLDASSNEESSVLIDLNTLNTDENNINSNENNNNNNNKSASTSYSINITKNISKTFQFFHINGPVTTRQVKLIVVPFGIRLLITSLIWDHYVNNYQVLLQNYSDNMAHRVSFIILPIQDPHKTIYFD